MSVTEKFEIVKQLGDGSFGSVMMGKNKLTGEIVAIKQMKKKFKTWEECTSLREVKSLAKLSKHINIIKLKEVIRDAQTEQLCFVFEFMEGNLYQRMRDRDGRFFSDAEVKKYTYQILLGLQHMHKHGFFHRDMKPENLLMTGDLVKIADFGLARETRSLPPYTEYVSTRWYRAPEVLLRSTTYSSPIDLWAVGCILAELVSLRPLFPGTSEVDQVFKICSIVGAPKPVVENLGSMNAIHHRPQSSTYYSPTNPRRTCHQIQGGGPWPAGIKLASAMGFKFPNMNAVAMEDVLPPGVAVGIVEVVADLLLYDPGRRPTAADVLGHEWFEGVVGGVGQKGSGRVVGGGGGLKEKSMSRMNVESVVSVGIPGIGASVQKEKYVAVVPMVTKVPVQSYRKPASPDSIGDISDDSDGGYDDLPRPDTLAKPTAGAAYYATPVKAPVKSYHPLPGINNTSTRESPAIEDSRSPIPKYQSQRNIGMNRPSQYIPPSSNATLRNIPAGGGAIRKTDLYYASSSSEYSPKPAARPAPVLAPPAVAAPAHHSGISKI
ncbi:hypothetical protein HDU98_003989 [Podochytrium sp. JEL0797]|nr:hypothetical protein HDU98_003989 [Podochytrium sp. JEL0797]